MHLRPSEMHPDDVLRLATHDGRFAITVHPTDRCNHTCDWCWYSRGKQRADGRALAQFLATCSADSVSEVIISGGGEPLMHPDIFLIANSIPRDVHTRLYTNGSIRRILLHVAERFDYIRVSIDAGTPDLYASLHGTRKGAFEELFQTLQLVMIRIPEIEVGLSAVVMRENKHTIQALLDRATASGIRYVMLKPELKGLTLESADLSDLKAPDSIKMYVRQAGLNAHGGAQTIGEEDNIDSSRHLFIDSNGAIYPCCHLTAHEFLAGDISNGFHATVTSKQFLAAAALHRSTPHSCAMHNLTIARKVQ